MSIIETDTRHVGTSERMVFIRPDAGQSLFVVDSIYTILASAPSAPRLLSQLSRVETLQRRCG